MPSTSIRRPRRSRRKPFAQPASSPALTTACGKSGAAGSGSTRRTRSRTFHASSTSCSARSRRPRPRPSCSPTTIPTPAGSTPPPGSAPPSASPAAASASSAPPARSPHRRKARRSSTSAPTSTGSAPPSAASGSSDDAGQRIQPAAVGLRPTRVLQREAAAEDRGLRRLLSRPHQLRRRRRHRRGGRQCAAAGMEERSARAADRPADPLPAADAMRPDLGDDRRWRCRDACSSMPPPSSPMASGIRRTASSQPTSI